MRAVVQRVARATVTVGEETVGAIDRGLVVLLGVGPNDNEKCATNLAVKIANLRIFSDAAGKFNLSALSLSAEVLVVSQFTLYADTSRGRRPSFTGAAAPDRAEPLVDHFVAELSSLGLRVATGRFGAHMQVDLANDGPVTLVLEEEAAD